MAELKFYIDRLSWKEILAFLYVCEATRKGALIGSKDPLWAEMLNTFATRIANLGAANRHEILCSHLQSVEDLDIYDDSLISPMIEKNRALVDELVASLASDPRYA